MKRKLQIFAATGLALSILVSVPITSSAIANTTAPIETQAYSTTISPNIYFTGNVVPPSTYYYTSGGWEGLLYLQSYQYDGTRTIGKYKGLVTCSSGACLTPTTK